MRIVGGVLALGWGPTPVFALSWAKRLGWIRGRGLENSSFSPKMALPVRGPRGETAHQYKGAKAVSDYPFGKRLV